MKLASFTWVYLPWTDVELEKKQGNLVIDKLTKERDRCYDKAHEAMQMK